jgi:hypothetical protein
MVEIVGKLCADLFLSGVYLGGDQRLFLHDLAQTAQQTGVFAQFFDQDIARAVQRILLGRDSLGDIGLRQHGRIGGAVGKDGTQQRLQPVFAGDHRLGAPLGFERKIKVLEHRFGVRPGNRAGERVGQLALRCDLGQNAGAALFQIAQIVQPLGQLAQLRIVKPACDLFAIARDKGHRIAGRRTVIAPDATVAKPKAVRKGGHCELHGSRWAHRMQFCRRVEDRSALCSQSSGAQPRQVYMVNLDTCKDMVVLGAGMATIVFNSTAWRGAGWINSRS